MKTTSLLARTGIALCLVAACADPDDSGGEGAEETDTSPESTDDGSETDGAETEDTAETGDTTEGTTDTGEETETDEGFETETPTVILPRTRIAKEELAVLVNDDDPQSVAVADYYVMAREIPEENVVHLSFPAGGDQMSADAFGPLKDQVDAALGDDIQALALTWTAPYRVGCMSITSAFTFGYGNQWCHTGGGCSETAESDYYDSESVMPYTDHGFRPAMMLAGDDSDLVFDLIDRGVAADGTKPTGDGYFIRTTDQARSVRWDVFVATVDYWDELDLTYIDNSQGNGSNVLSDTDDVLFYFTGLAQVADIDTNTYLPGAVADHLTSFGGQITGSGQMSCTEWLKAGATASFGTVREPCNFPTKFPNTFGFLRDYFRGQTLIEAYWKSVAWPGEGIFVGEPLAAPWDWHEITYDPDAGLLEITATFLRPYTKYDIEEADSEDGPWTTLFEGQIPKEQTLTIPIMDVTSPFYRIVEQE